MKESLTIPAKQTQECTINMAPSVSYFDFGGSNQVSLGALTTVDSGGAPFRLQKKSFPGIPGEVVLNHGAAARIMTFTGLVWATQSGTDTTDLIALTSAIITVQANRIVGTFRHDLTNTTVDYGNCMILDVKPSNKFGVGGGLRSMKYKLIIEQLYW